MPLDVILMAGTGVVLALAMWQLVRRHRLSWKGPVSDVPDAPPAATPIAAPGVTPPYSSLDPSAPPKRHADGTRVDGLPDEPS